MSDVHFFDTNETNIKPTVTVKIKSSALESIMLLNSKVLKSSDSWKDSPILQHVRFLHISVRLIRRGSLKVPQFQPNTKSIYPYVHLLHHNLLIELII